MEAKSMKLYAYWRSSCSWRVRIALALKKMDYEVMPVHLLQGGGEQYRDAYVQKNPMEQVPMLEWEEQGKVRRLSQSLAIVEWLEQVCPTPALLPSDAYWRAKARQLAELINAGTQPLQNLSVMQYVSRLSAEGQASPEGQASNEGQAPAVSAEGKAFAKHFVAKGLVAFEKDAAALHREHQGSFSVGDSPSIADVLLVPQLYNARRFAIDLATMPRLLAIEEACMKLSAFVEAHPDQQPDAEIK